MNIAIGQEIAIQSSYNDNSYMFGYAVAKVTPTGQVGVKRTADGYEMRFDKDGYRMDGASSRYRRERLVIDLNAAHEDVRRAAAQLMAADAINAIRGNAGRRNDKESMREQVAKLAELLEAARVAVEAI